MLALVVDGGFPVAWRTGSADTAFMMTTTKIRIAHAPAARFARTEPLPCPTQAAVLQLVVSSEASA